MINICLVSTRFWAVCNPILYRTVDFLSRGTNRGPEKHTRILQRQVMWTRQILANPNLGRLVKSFSWSIMHNINGPSQWERNYNEEWELNFEEGTTALYNMFRLISTATQCCIEVVSSPGHHEIRPPRDLHNLFPQAQDITLRGAIHPILASAILHGSGKPALIRLTLENIIDPWRPEVNTLAGIGTRALQSRCQNLKVLKIRKHGRFDNKPPRSCVIMNTDHLHRAIVEKDEMEYEQAAHIIQLLEPESLIFAYGKQVDHMLNPIYRDREIEEGLKRGNCPKDLYFRQYIEPILIMGWPALKALDIRGVKEEFTANLRSLPLQLTTTEEWERGP